MKERSLLGICKCCGQRIESSFVCEDVDTKNITLKNYKDYKQFEVNRCPNCDYVSDNIFVDEVPNDIREIVESEDYQYVLNYEYIAEEVDPDVWEYEISAYNPNEFEAYALILDCLGDYENEIRALMHCITLKEKLIKYMRKIQYEECGDVDWSEEYDKIDFLLKESININLEEIQEVYRDISAPLVYTEMLYIEALSKMGAIKEAKAKLKDLRSRVKLSQDLTDYFNSVFA